MTQKFQTASSEIAKQLKSELGVNVKCGSKSGSTAHHYIISNKGGKPFSEDEVMKITSKLNQYGLTDNGQPFGKYHWSCYSQSIRAMLNA